MSFSDESRTTSSSRLSQFGLYRTIDTRTEEFLKLSRKRQIRQGCACAAVSTALTVTVVVIILLIYEYAIVVESTSSVQNRRGTQYNKTNEKNDGPVADRLDRSYFGFDQDYYERMPLMVNAMQENSYVDPSAETMLSKHKARFLIANITSIQVPTKPTTSTVNYRTSSIRRTSPRPFNYEYRHPTPTPFGKTFGSRSWIESYRSAQRLKNLQQVIKYLEKTINAKFGDIYTLPTSTIAFSGLYVEPMANDSQQKVKVTSPTVDLQQQSTNKVETIKMNHQSDPLYSFKPESPGDVNLLAEGFFRFSPAPTPSSSFAKEISFSTNLPMFRPISHRKRNCIGIRCTENNRSKVTNVNNKDDIGSTDTSFPNKAKSFSVMLNLFPLNTDQTDYKKLDSFETTQPPIRQIYLTTMRPIIQFRRRSTVPIRRNTMKYQRPRIISNARKSSMHDHLNLKDEVKNNEPKMIVHVNVYSPVETKTDTKDQTTVETITSPITTQSNSYKYYATEVPYLTSTQVEDYHLGSSGVIPIESRLTPAPPPPISTMPIMTTISPVYDLKISSSELNTWTSTRPPDVIKFSHEDAKVPEEYQTLFFGAKINNVSKHYENVHYKNKNTQPEINRRNSNGDTELKDEYTDIESRTLVVKLKNEIDTTISTTTTEEITEETRTDDEEEREVKEVTTIRTYVPQINGHYRSLNQNSRNINNWLNSPETNRKRRLEMSVSGIRKPTYVPQYVEIMRNNTKKYDEEENHNDDS